MKELPPAPPENRTTDEKEVAGEEEKDSPKRSIQEEVAEAEVDRLQREKNLDELFYEERASWVGRDSYGRVTNRVRNGNLNQAGRDLHYHAGGADESSVAVDLISTQEAERLLMPLVPTSSQEETRKLLDRERVVLIHGSENTGRATAAMAALLDWAWLARRRDEDPPVGWIRLEGPRPRLRDLELLEGHGYVMELADADLDSRIRQLRSLADQNDCRVVILVPSESLAPTEAIVEHQPPPGIEVFKRRLSYEAHAAKLAVPFASHVPKEIKEELGDETAPRKAAGLACRVVRGLSSGRSVEEILGDLPNRIREEIRKKLHDRRPVLGRCFMASIAVLHGLPETVVSESALSLAKLIDDEWRSEAKTRPIPIWEQLPAWLDYARATTLPIAMVGGGMTVRLRQPKNAAVMLRVLWEDQPTIRNQLITWLHSMGDSPDPEIQMKVAHAVGRLATFNFRVVDEKFLKPWSRSDRVRSRRLAALMLEAAAQDPDLTTRVHLQLQRMASGTRGERAIVVRAYASQIGTDAPDMAMRVFRKLGFRLDKEFNPAVAQSVYYLYSQETAVAILLDLASWAREDGQGGRNTAALSLSRLAALPSGNPARPVLTSLDLQDQELRKALITLWRNALGLYTPNITGGRRPRATPEAWPLFLGGWISRYEEQPNLRPVIDEVLRSADRKAERQLVHLYLRMWWQRRHISQTLYKHLNRLAEGN
ncbi:hypothetical protein ACQP10_34795 [Streptosporangium sandarakinum]|uniref:hypothetical protein n=1 Tax=Streptosporangium sandarakinum TaxID=1260955 RepID=UPI003D8B854E